ncbi:protein of unknown function (plasmid) [Pararobbsia alpina]
MMQGAAISAVWATRVAVSTRVFLYLYLYLSNSLVDIIPIM